MENYGKKNIFKFSEISFGAYFHLLMLFIELFLSDLMYSIWFSLNVFDLCLC